MSLERHVNVTIIKRAAGVDWSGTVRYAVQYRFMFA